MNESRIHKCKDHKKEETLFIIGMLAIPTLNWLIWWLYVNLSTFTLAFQNRGEWSLINFQQLYNQVNCFLR